MNVNLKSGPKKTSEEGTETTSLLFVGDCILSTGFTHNSFSEAIRHHIGDAELSIANIEAPIDTETPTTKSGPIKVQSESDINTLSSVGFDVGTLANNHMMDQGVLGLQKTIGACSNANISTVGVGENHENAVQPLIKNVGGTEIAILNFCGREFGIATHDSPGVAWVEDPDTWNVVEEVTDKVDITILVAHGGLEYVPIPPFTWQRTLRSFVDRGVDAVIAHHPHVAQGWEIYDGSPIAYSLGDFAFEKANRPETNWSYMFELKIVESMITEAHSYLIQTDNATVRYMSPEHRPKHNQYLKEISTITSSHPNNKGYWQEIALRLFNKKYNDKLQTYGEGHILSLVHNPIQELNALTKGIKGRSELQEQKELYTLDYFQYSSHRDAIETALRIRTGIEDDKRKQEIVNQVDELLAWTDPKRSTIEKYRQRVKTVIGRLIN